MDVWYRRWRKIIVNDKVDAFEINTATHKLGTNQYPNFSFPERFDHIVSLFLGSIGVNYIHIYAIVDEFAE